MREHCLKVYVSDEELQSIRLKAEQSGSTLSRYLRHCGTRRCLSSKIDRQSVTELMQCNGDLARLGNLMKLTMSELADEENNTLVEKLLIDAHETLMDVRVLQDTLKARIHKLQG